MRRGGTVAGIQPALASGCVGSAGVLGRGFSVLRTGRGRSGTWTWRARAFALARRRGARISANTEIIQNLEFEDGQQMLKCNFDSFIKLDYSWKKLKMIVGSKPIML